MTLSGGHALGEMMMPGAREGSVCLRDQIANSVIEVDEVDEESTDAMALWNEGC